MYFTTRSCNDCRLIAWWHGCGESSSFPRVPIFFAKDFKSEMAIVLDESVRRAAVQHILQMRLQYMFSVTAMPPRSTGAPQRLRFLFSKPTPQQPVPAISVWMDVEVLETLGTATTYALYVEGQQYRRVITIDGSNIRGDEFNERLIDKVYGQKSTVRQAHLWKGQKTRPAPVQSLAAMSAASSATVGVGRSGPVVPPDFARRRHNAATVIQNEWRHHQAQKTVVAKKRAVRA